MRSLPGSALLVISLMAFGGCPGDDDAPVTPDAALAPDAEPCISSLSFSPVAAGMNQPTGIALDDQNVYWSDEFTNLAIGGGRIFSAPKDGSAPPKVLLSVADVHDFGIRGLAVHGGALYWVDHRYLPESGETVDTIRTMPVTGGTPIDLASGNHVRFIVGDDGVFYSHIDVSTSDGLLSRVPLTGGAVTQLGSSSDQFDSLAADATDLFGSMGVAGVWRMDKRGGDAIIIAPSVRGEVLLHGDDVYWIARTPGLTVGRMAKNGGKPEPEVISIPDVVYYQAVLDGDVLYLRADTLIDRVPLAGGSVEHLLCPAGGASMQLYGMALDATHIYVLHADASGNGVMRAARVP